MKLEYGSIASWEIDWVVRFAHSPKTKDKETSDVTKLKGIPETNQEKMGCGWSSIRMQKQ